MHHELREDKKLETKSLIEVCPLCGSQLEKGYLASASAAWSNRKISNWSIRGLWNGELVIGDGFAFRINNIDAYRCKKCKLVIFQYGDIQTLTEGSV